MHFDAVYKIDLWTESWLVNLTELGICSLNTRFDIHTCLVQRGGGLSSLPRSFHQFVYKGTRTSAAKGRSKLITLFLPLG